jgi:uncharacterized membrane protein
MEWYYAVRGQRHGPVDIEVLASRVRQGQVRAEDLVWSADQGDAWVKASTVPALATALASPPEVAIAAAGTFAGRTHNRDLMVEAKACLRGGWGNAIGVVLVAILILSVLGVVPAIGTVGVLLLGGPISLGLTIYFLAVVRRRPAQFSMLFEGFNRFGTALGTYLLMWLIVSLLLLLLIVPGIIMALSYAMTYYIIADHPERGVWSSMEFSRQMMRGNRWKLFCLYWRFFGWALLCMLTLGIGFLWLIPYMHASFARFYEDLKAGPSAPVAAGVMPGGSAAPSA